MPQIDQVEVEVLSNHLISIVHEMGAILRRTSYSPNIREREDCSCVLADTTGQIIAQAEHIPGHLGMRHRAAVGITEESDAIAIIVSEETGEISYGKIPPYSVVVPGSLPDKNNPSAPSLSCAVIIKQVDEKTRSKTSINDLLRE